MASSQNVGTLTAFINADATALVREFNKVDRQVARWSASMTKPGAQLALGFLGVENALKAVTNSVRNVVANIESIPGVPAETVASIMTLRGNLADAKGTIDQMVAGIAAFGVRAAQAVGVGAAGLFGFKDTSALAKLETPDEIARARDAGFDAKVDAARKKLAAASRASSVAAMTEVQQIAALRAEAARYETFAAASSLNTVQRLEAQASAQEKLNAANEKMAALRKELAAAEQKSGDAFGATLGAAMPAPALRLEALQGQAAEVRRRITELQMGDQSDPANLQAQIRAREQLTKIYERQVPLLEEQKRLGEQIGTQLSSTFAAAVVEGRKFSEVLRGLAADLAQMLLQKSLLGVFAPFTGGLGKIAAGFFGGAKADGGPVSARTPYLVGERGPELFLPEAAGKIVPNHRLGRGGGSGAAGPTFYIDARGADRAGLAELSQAVARLNGSIEERAVAAVFNRSNRGGNFRKAFA